MSIDPQVETFRSSLNRCLAKPTFLQGFYERFLASSSEVRDKFRGTDFSRQARVLGDSLYLMAVAAQGERESPAWAEMERLAKLHARGERDIRPEFYDLWLDCLVAVASEHDPSFTPAVEQAWRRTLGEGIEFLRSRY